jgi:heme-degrading monooxygenase HmoA
MYVRILWGRLRHGMWPEYEKHYNERIQSITQGLGGFQGRQLLQSTENPDEGLSITLWDSLEDLRSYDQSPGRQEAARAVEHLYTGEYWVRNFEIKSSTI